MQKWEYLEIDFHWRDKKRCVYHENGKDVSSNKWDSYYYLNKAGEEGWELIINSGDVLYVFKRPKP